MAAKMFKKRKKHATSPGTLSLLKEMRKLKYAWEKSIRRSTENKMRKIVRHYQLLVLNQLLQSREPN